MVYVDRVKTTTNDSPKVAETKKRIKDAFITLYAKQPIEKIDIKSITDLAGFNRGTFYTYFLDIYDLLAQIEADFFDYVDNNVEYLLKSLFSDQEIEEALLVVFNREDPAYIKVLVATPGKSKLPEILKVKLKNALRNELKTRSIFSEPHDAYLLEYFLEYVASAHYGVITRWIINNMDLPILELVTFLKTSFSKICKP